MPEIAAILLAAGESRRMGKLKALLPWQGQTLVAHQLSALAEAGVDRIVVVVGHRHEELVAEVDGKARAEWVLNPDYLQGKTTSIKAGLRALEKALPESLLLLNVDQPRSAATVAEILARHRAAGPLITIPAHGGKGGHPIVFDGALIDELSRIEEETQGIREVVRRYGQDTQRIELDTPEVLWDLNTPEQYREALENARRT